jgi:CRISPR-associated protein Cas2
MLYLIIYDITNNAIRAKIAKTLMAEGYERLQYSVYLGLDNPKYNLSMINQFQKLLQAEPDAKFYIFPIPKSSIRQMQFIGKNFIDINYITGDCKSLLI